MSSPRPKFDWYETDQMIVLSILVKNMVADRVSVQFEPRTLTFAYKPESGEPVELNLRLSSSIDAGGSSFRVTPVKAEIKMHKVANFRWGKLEAAEDDTTVPLAKPSMANLDDVVEKAKAVQSSHQNKLRNWDQQVKEVEKEEEDQGGVEELFRRIYATSSEEVRRAMNKSFQESNGTVLSTNWEEVMKDKVEMKPPESSEFKKW